MRAALPNSGSAGTFEAAIWSTILPQPAEGFPHKEEHGLAWDWFQPSQRFRPKNEDLSTNAFSPNRCPV